MKNDFDHLLELPGAPEEREWIKERLETLSVREGYILSTTLLISPPQDANEVVECLHSLGSHSICFPAGNYEQLGQFCQAYQLKLPDSVIPYVNMEELGQWYEDLHPGLFIGNCYVAYPEQPLTPARQENGLPLLWDAEWSVKLKLASPAVPEGVWLRLPDYSELTCGRSMEVELALDALQASSLEKCVLLDAICILPEAGDLMEQYDSITELVRDGNNLGYIMDEQGQGEKHWMEKYSAALEYEDCRTLRFALDISQNLQCYEWVSGEELTDLAADHLLSAGVPEGLLQSGCIDLEKYAEDLLETAGYTLDRGENGCITRNSRGFIREHTAPEGSGMTMR